MTMTMTIKGCLWHEGSDGLGVGPMWLRKLLPYRKRFDAAARVHDACYDIKGDGRDRFAYDKHLLEMMIYKTKESTKNHGNNKRTTISHHAQRTGKGQHVSAISQ